MNKDLARKVLTNAASARFRKFAPIDRDSAIFEVLVDDHVIIDVARTHPNGDFEIGFHDAIVGYQISVAAFRDIVQTAEEMVKNDEGEPLG